MFVSPKVSSPEDRRRQLWFCGHPIQHALAPRVFNEILLPAVGLPDYNYGYLDCSSLQEKNAPWHVENKNERTLGTCLTMPIKIQAMSYCDHLTDVAKAVGSSNTTYFRETIDGKQIIVGTNCDVDGVKAPLLNALSGHPSPFPSDVPTKFLSSSPTAAFCVGGGGAVRAVIYALSTMAISTIYVFNRDQQETEAAISQFPHLNLIYIGSKQQLYQILSDKSLPPIILGVGAIPSIEPQTPEEKLVYEIADHIFASSYKRPSSESSSTESLQYPEKRIFLDMSYKPPKTILREMATKHGWTSICGIESVLECCFEQLEIWTGKVASREIRDKARAEIRRQYQEQE